MCTLVEAEEERVCTSAEAEEERVCTSAEAEGVCSHLKASNKKSVGATFDRSDTLEGTEMNLTEILCQCKSNRQLFGQLQSF